LYAKLFTSIYQGTLRGNSHGLLVFTNMLAHCDKAGHCDMHPKAIAEEVGLTLEQVKAAIEELEAPDDESRSPEESGRRIIRLDEHRAWGWRVVNYIKYRSIRDEEDRREQNRKSQEAWRLRKQSKPTSASVSQDKPQSAHTEAEAEAEAYSVAKATGGKPPKQSPEEIIFGYGVPLLSSAGSTEKAARSFLGGLRKSHGDDAVVNALRDCIRAKPLQPLEWMAKALPPDGIGGKQTALERRNAAVVQKLMGESNA
jgi:hypothetical protein